MYSSWTMECDSDYSMKDCPWARAHSAASWQSHWSRSDALQQRMLRVQQKRMQEQQDDEEVFFLSPTLAHPRLPLPGPSNPHAISLQNVRLGKRNNLDVKSMDYSPPRPHSSYTRSKLSVRSIDEHGQTRSPEPRPSEQGPSCVSTLPRPLAAHRLHR